MLLLRPTIPSLRPGCSAETPCDGIGTRLGGFGLRFPAFTFLLAEGRTGGPEHFHTYLLLANVDDTPTPVRLTFLRENGLAQVSKEIMLNANSYL